MAIRNMASYRQHMLARAQQELYTVYGRRNLRNKTVTQIAKREMDLRAYPGLATCDMERVRPAIHLLTAESVTSPEIAEAKRIKLAGEEIVEDAAAGEATRLGLGTKYLLTPQKLTEAILLNNLRNPNDIITLPIAPKELLPISLGLRHKLQYIYDLIALATEAGLNPGEVLKDQVTLTIINEETALGILRETVKYDHFGLTPENTLFMVQEKSLGMGIEKGRLFFDQRSEFLLWNHGDMKIQQTLEGKVFFVRLDRSTGELEKVFLQPEDVETIMARMKNLISYPIEDLDYLTGSINLQNLAVALRLGNQGYRMTMEAVAQKAKPQKGGFFTFDPNQDRVVCIESDCGGNVVDNTDPASLARIKFLNKNFNNFPSPVEAFRALAGKEMPLHLTVKGGALYPQTPQGDQNFNLPTAVVMWNPVTTIHNLKVLADSSATLLAMAKQDKQTGFIELAKSLGIFK